MGKRTGGRTPETKGNLTKRTTFGDDLPLISGTSPPKLVNMYSYNNHTEAISARLAPGLKERIDFECQQYFGMNRNKFINQAAGLLLDLRHEVRCGNIDKEQLPPTLARHCSNL